MAILFDRASLQFVTITGYKGVTGTNPRTISAWIKTSTLANQFIIGWGTSSPGEKYVLRLEPDGDLRIEVASGNRIGTTNLADGVWHHVAATWFDDGTPNIVDALLYVDGALESISASTPFALNTGSTIDVTIGKRISSGSDRYFDGSMEDVRIYSRSLSAAEIQTIYASRGTDMIVDGLAVRYLMNEDAPGQTASGAGVIKDGGPSGLNGTPTNTPTWADGELNFKRRFMAH